jgi:holin-like protein
MIEALTLILLCQLGGEVAVAATGLPLPGPVVGMVILFVGLLARGSVPQALATVGGALLDNLALLFVPAGVGVMVHMELLRQQWLPISLSLLFSTLLAILVTGWVMKRLIRPQAGEGAEK